VPLPRYHLLASTALGLSLGGGRRLGASLASGFLVDVDHLVDYFFARHTRIVLPLHGWELVPLAIAFDRRLRLGGALAASYALHIAMDQLWNEKRSPLAYFLTYRASKRFREQELGATDPARRHVWRRSSPLGLLRWL
jgi:hypothetical protein